MKDCTVLVTGGTGSFGHAFVRRVLELGPKKVIVFSRDELKQYEMAQQFGDQRLRFLLGDVRDRDRLYRVFDGVDYVVHAAALKQVPAAERDPIECIKTNVLGAQNVIEAAVDRGVGRVVALSSDKAAGPVNLYGASKLCSDKLFTAANAYSRHTRFSVVRYGNVVGSRGSVVPLFLQQREKGALTITDPRMTRFFITLDQGVDLVFLALQKMYGGEIFVPEIPSVRITDLAEAIAPECKVITIGIRPGEKLHEVLITEDDARRTVKRDGYFVIQPDIPKDARQDWGVHVEPSNLTEGFRYASDTNDQWLEGEGLWEFISSQNLAPTTTAS